MEGGRRTARAGGGVGGGTENVVQHVGNFRVEVGKGGNGAQGGRGVDAGMHGSSGWVRSARWATSARSCCRGWTYPHICWHYICWQVHVTHFTAVAVQRSLSGVIKHGGPVTHQLLPGDAKLLHLPLSHTVIQVGDDGAGHLIRCCFSSVAWIGQRAAGAVGAG